MAQQQTQQQQQGKSIDQHEVEVNRALSALQFRVMETMDFLRQSLAEAAKLRERVAELEGEQGEQKTAESGS
jgi:hypothetical protein